MNKPTEPFEALIVWGGFENRIGDFTMDDFRGDKLPNYPEPENSNFKRFCYIQMQKPGSSCRWGYSRWVTGETGKLEMLDQNWDSNG